MTEWNSDQYLRFANERTQPAIDLAARISLAAPRSAIDLGCGPGNSTEILAGRWPNLAVCGLDNSPAMLAAARRTHPSWTWIEQDLAAWSKARTDGSAPGSYDVVFSNAALHWVPDHAMVIPQLLRRVAPGGALAFQVPHTLDLPHQSAMRDLARSDAWRDRFVRPPVAWHVESAAFYYDALAPAATRVDLWTTEYAHVLAGVDAVVDWYRGTGIRPYLEALPDDAAREGFLRDYRAEIAPHFPARRDGKVILFFRRLFVIAYR